MLVITYKCLNICLGLKGDSKLKFKLSFCIKYHRKNIVQVERLKNKHIEKGTKEKT